MGRETLDNTKLPKSLWQDMFNYIVAAERASPELVAYFMSIDSSYDEDWMNANVAYLEHKYSNELTLVRIAISEEEFDPDWDEEFEGACHDREQLRRKSRF